jgi:hypothetical protein
MYISERTLIRGGELWVSEPAGAWRDGSIWWLGQIVLVVLVLVLVLGR